MSLINLITLYFVWIHGELYVNSNNSTESKSKVIDHTLAYTDMMCWL